MNRLQLLLLALTFVACQRGGTSDDVPPEAAPAVEHAASEGALHEPDHEASGEAEAESVVDSEPNPFEGIDPAELRPVCDSD